MPMMSAGGGLAVTGVAQICVYGRPPKIEDGEKRPSVTMAKGGKGVAARCVTLVSAIFAFANERGICAANPARGVKKAPVRKVERFLSEAEIARLAAALDAEAERTGNPFPFGPC
jgi:hypothetical protein